MGGLDLNVESIYNAINKLNAGKDNLNELNSYLNSIDTGGITLNSMSLLNNAKSLVKSTIIQSFDDVLGKLNNTKNIIASNDINASIQFAFLEGKFNDEFGNYDEDKVRDYVDEYYDKQNKYQYEYNLKLKNSPTFRYEVALDAMLSNFGYDSLEQLDLQREQLLSTVRELQQQKNDLMFSDAKVTFEFLNVINDNYNGVCSYFDGIANSETLLYRYVDIYGIENYSWTLDAIPKNYQSSAQPLTYTDKCKNGDLYNEVKNRFDNNCFFANYLNQNYRNLTTRIQEQINADNKEIVEIDEMLGIKRNELGELDSTRQYIVDEAKYYADNEWKYTLQEDFQENCKNVSFEIVSNSNTLFKNDNTHLVVSKTPYGEQNKYKYVHSRQQEMNIIYSLISGDNEFHAIGDQVVYYNDSGEEIYVKSTNSMLSNIALWANDMTEEQKQIFYYNWNTGNYDAAYNYLNDISDRLNSRYIYNRTMEDQKFAMDNPGLASTFSVLLAPAEGLKAFEHSALQLLSEDGKIYSSHLYSHSDTMRSQVSYNIANSGEKFAAGKAFMYNVGMSIADNLFSVAVTGGSPINSGLCLAMGGFDNNMNDALSRGLSDEEAFGFSLSMAGVEAATEAFSVDNLLDLKLIKNADDIVKGVGKFINASDDAVTTVVKNVDSVVGGLKKYNNFTDDIFGNLILKADNIPNPNVRNFVYKLSNLLYGAVSQGFGEGGEELASSIMGELVDKAWSGENSAFNLTVEGYINKGYTEAEAIALSQKQQLDEFAMSYLSGLTSGSMSGGGKLAGSMAFNDMSSFVSNIFNKHKDSNYDAFASTISNNINNRNFEGAIENIFKQDGISLNEKVLYANSLISSLSNGDNRIISEGMQQKLNDIVKNIESKMIADRDNLILQINQKISNLGLTSEQYIANCASVVELDSSIKQKVYNEAMKLHNKAISFESSISSFLHSLETDGIHLAGFEHRFKSVDSIARKISTILAKKNSLTEFDVIDCANRVNDSLRYTFILDKSNYSSQFYSILSKFRSNDYSIEWINNKWGESIYQGINVSMISPTGVKMEVQFHTQESYDVKEKFNHAYYEIARSNYPSIEIKNLAVKLMKLNQQMYVHTIDDMVDLDDKDIIYNLKRMENYYLCKNDFYLDYFDNVNSKRTEFLYDLILKKYQGEISSWSQSIKSDYFLNKLFAAYIDEGNFFEAGCYSTVNSIMRGSFIEIDSVVFRGTSGRASLMKFSDFETLLVKKKIVYNGKKILTLQDFIDMQIDAFNKINAKLEEFELKEPTVIYRGVNWDALKFYKTPSGDSLGINSDDSSATILEKIKSAGGEFVDKSFMSSSTSPNDPVTLRKPVIFKMFCDPGTKGAFLEEVGGYENEFLFAAGTKFDVFDVKIEKIRGKDKVVIYMKTKGKEVK